MTNETELTEDSVPRLGRGVRLKHDKVRGMWVLLSPERVFELDPVAVEIIKRVDGRINLGAIVDDLSEAFTAERAEILQDVFSFLEQLAARQVIET